jgi:hypothetical protein
MERTLTEPVTFEFSSGISPDHAEQMVARLAEEEAGARVVLRFTGYPYVNAGVGWRVGNAIRRFSGEPLSAHVPPVGTGDWFRTFTRSGLGIAIATHAARAYCDGEDVTAKIQDLYLREPVRRDQNAVTFSDLHRGVGVNPEREDLFRDAFVAALRKVNVGPANFDRDRLRDVIKFTFEAIQNVYDHARRKPLPEGTRILSYFLLGYYKSIAGHPDPTGRLKGYGERLSALTGRKRTDFMQVCVNDDGVGIAARQSQNAEIYRGSIEWEEAAVHEALRAHSSVKLRAQDCRIRGTAGEGYTYIDACLRALRAMAVLRTGRLLAVLDGTSDAEPGFTLVNRGLGYMPGTTLDVLIPIIKEGDGQPLLFPDE